MKLIVKKLQGGECTIEVQPSTLISEVKRQIAAKLNVSIEEQKLLLRGKTLVDEEAVKSYPFLKDGSKLNLVIKKPEGLYDIALKSFKKSGMTDVEAKITTKKFLTALQNNINKLSWDDIERLASDCLEGDEKLKKPLTEKAV